MSLKYSFALVVTALWTGIALANDCDLPPDSGTRDDATGGIEEIRYFYSSTNFKCSAFPFSGSNGNANNFQSLEDCKAKCVRPFSEISIVTKITAAQKEGKCFYGNKTYAVQDRIPETTADSPCSIGCFCSGHTTPTSINCAVVDCPPPPPGQQGKCVKVKSRETCCGEWYCPSQDKPKPFTCAYKGKEYFEGQSIYFDKDPYTCLNCVCTKDFKGVFTTENGICKELNCGMAINRQLQLAQGCKPKYYTSDAGIESCCPIEWECPNAGGQ